MYQPKCYSLIKLEELIDRVVDIKDLLGDATRFVAPLFFLLAHVARDHLVDLAVEMPGTLLMNRLGRSRS